MASQKKQTSLLAFFAGSGGKAAASTKEGSASEASSPAKRKLPSTFATTTSSTSEPPKKQSRPTELAPQVAHLIADLHDQSWRRVLEPEFTEPYFVRLAKFLEQERQAKTIYPPADQVFSQLNLCPFDDVKVVILGQDPYHGAGQAHGLAFSVALGVNAPPSLKNVFKELLDDPDVDFEMPNHGNLEKWARQGVLLLNAVLTVEAAKPNSHQGKGWESFTDAIIKAINNKKEGVVFMLWGRYAQEKGKIINKRKHHVLVAAHPSPLAGNKFAGNRHFSTANNLLKQRTLAGEAKMPIEWKLDSKDEERENQRRWLAEHQDLWAAQQKEEAGAEEEEEHKGAAEELQEENDDGEGVDPGGAARPQTPE